MSQPLCILIHGFTGNSREVAPLADALARSGYDVMAPLLPGHHDTKKRMEKVQASDWIRTVEELTEKAINEHRELHLIGFSMGAMIAVLLGYRYSIRSLVLLSPAVYVVTPNVLITRSKQILKLIRENRSLFKKTMRDNLMDLRSTPFHNVLQFQKVVRAAKKAIPRLHVPVCIIHGLEDEVVDPKSSEWIYSAISSRDKELHMLCHSKHVLCHDVEVNLLVQTVTRFLKKHR